MLGLVRRLLRRGERFAPGERVVFVPDGTPGVVNRSAGGYSHVFWEDENPPEDFGGSRVPNSKLRRADDSRRARSSDI